MSYELLDKLLDPELAREVIDNPPPNHRVVEALEDALIAIDQQDFELATKKCRKALKWQKVLSSNNVTDVAEECEMTSPSLIYELLGMALDKQNKKEEAIEAYLEALKADPNNATASYQIGRIHDDLSRPLESIVFYQKAIQSDPDFVDAHYDLGIIFRSLGRISDSIESYRKVLSLDPNRIEALCNLGVLLKETDQLDESIELYRKAIELKPNHGPCHFNLAIALKGKRGCLEEAIKAYRKALDCGYITPDVYYGLGLALELQGDISQAIQSYSLAIEGDVLHARARYRIAVLIAAEEEEAEGEEGEKEGRTGWNLDELIGPELGKKVRREVEALKTEGVMPLEYVRQEFDCYANSFDSTLLTQLHYTVPEQLLTLLQPSWDFLFDSSSCSTATTSSLSASASTVVCIDLGCGTGIVGSSLRSSLKEKKEKNDRLQIVGIDISSAMLAKAGERGPDVYNELLCTELVEGLQQIIEKKNEKEKKMNEKSPCVTVAADVLPYLGDLSSLFEHVQRVSLPGSIFAFSTEDAREEEAEEEEKQKKEKENKKNKKNTKGYRLHRRSGRYRHEESYIRELSRRFGFEVLEVKSVQGRYELGVPIQCHLYLLKVTPSPPSSSSSSSSSGDDSGTITTS